MVCVNGLTSWLDCFDTTFHTMSETFCHVLAETKEIGMIDERETNDLMAIYRRRALRRLKSLSTKHQTPAKIADYLYHVNRCGIAHGRRIVRADIVPSYFEMVRDTYIMRLLARMAIDEKLGASRL